jgi:ATP-dependent helicase HrpB
VRSVLPIDEHLPALIASLEQRSNLVLVAEPGAGKTTRVPQALLGARFLGTGQALVLEPRRIAARMAARRVASELEERVGERVGYVVRFEREVTARTRVVFLTEALLTRRFLEDPSLRGVSCVVLDEFHERSLHTDLGLALLRELQVRSRPELRIVVMSATLDAERIAQYLDAPVMRVPGRAFPVHIEHLERPDERKLEEQVSAGVRRFLVRKVDGDVLVFLPGAAEIRRAQEACEELARSFDCELAPLHGDLPPAEQDRAVTRGPKRKIVLSTNIAETSLTLEGVAAVLDTGLARVAGHSPWSGLSTLQTAKISRASAIQRAGRAGRVREGHAFRLYTKADFDARPSFDVPELLKSDLAETELLVRALFAERAGTLPWFEPPPESAQKAADDLLLRLEAVALGGSLTALGRKMLDMPVHPRLARLALALAERGYHDEAALVTALVAEREVRLSQRTSFRERAGKHDQVGASDLLARLEAFEALAGDHSAQSARRHELDFQAVRSVVRMREQLERHLRSVPRSIDQPFEEALRVSTLLAYADRVGKRRTKNGSDIVLSGGGSASLSEASVVKEAEFMVAVEADERGRSAGPGAFAAPPTAGQSRNAVRTASAIEPEWLLEYFPARIRDEQRVAFDSERERVEVTHAMMYDALALDESKKLGEHSPEVSRVLAQAALAKGPAAPWDDEAVVQWQRRALFAAKYDARIKPLDDAGLLEVLLAHCSDKSSFDDLRADPFDQALPALMGPGVRARLEELAPTRIRLPSGRELRINYELDRPPWVESRLQDFFGMLDGPKLAGGAVPLVIHLLAPNQRPVQVTTDLSGFWDRHYPAVKKELMRRYPRHSWPDDPRTARPPERKR